MRGRTVLKKGQTVSRGTEDGLTYRKGKTPPPLVVGSESYHAATFQSLGDCIVPSPSLQKDWGNAMLDNEEPETVHLERTADDLHEQHK